MNNYYLQKKTDGAVIHKVGKSTVREMEFISLYEGQVRKIYSTDAHRMIKSNEAVLVLF